MTRITRTIRSIDHFELIGRMTLVLLIVNTNEQPVAFTAAIIATAVLFLRPARMRQPWPWFGLAVVVGGVQLSEWWRIDDHVAVTTYWLLAIGLSRLGSRPMDVLAVSARLLVGTVFALAFGWKVLSSQFVSTDFFRFQLATDERFALVAEHLGGTDESALLSDRIALGTTVSNRPASADAVLQEGPRHRSVALVFTAWGIVIEGAVAAAHLLPLRGRWRRLRIGTLLAFGYTTYAVVPVAGFGALLMTLGIAMHDSPRSRLVLVGSATIFLIWGAIFPALV